MKTLQITVGEDCRTCPCYTVTESGCGTGKSLLCLCRAFSRILKVTEGQNGEIRTVHRCRECREAEVSEVSHTS